MISPELQAIADQLADWRENPRRFVYDNFHVDPDVWQGEVLDALIDPKIPKISMQACAGPGKSAVLAWIVLWFLATQGDRHEHPKGAALSITADNLADNLWPEISKWQQRSPYLMKAFKWTKSRIFALDAPETWFVSARTFSKTANAEEQGRTLSGLHSKYVLYVIDESGDISPNVLKSAEQGLSTGPVFGKILQAGNPTSLDGMLYAAAQSDAWHCIRITGDPEDPRRSPRIDIDWARQQIKEYGREDDWVKSFILGTFPSASMNALFGPDMVEEAMARRHKLDVFMHAQKRLGVDVARFGSDETIIFPRWGLNANFKHVAMRKARTTDIAGKVIMVKNKWGSEMEFVDGTGGYGGGVVDQMLAAHHAPIEVQFGGKPDDDRYLNKRAEMWFRMKEWVERGGSLPKNPTLKKQLCAPLYFFRNGKFQLEDKDQLKKRLGYSPDIADALALTFAFAEMRGTDHPEAKILKSFNKNNDTADYDPFRNA